MSYINSQSYNMSTTTVQMAACSKDVLTQVEQELIDIEKKMSFYLESSDVSKINRSSAKQPISVSKETMDVIKYSLKYCNLTDGAFDITIAPIISEWGIFSESEKIPDKNRISELLKLKGSDNIIIDEKNCTVSMKKDGQKIDLGGIAKEYASDKAIEIYKNNNVKSAMINIGGNVSLLGNKEDGSMWTVGIQSPYMQRENILGAVKCSDTSIVTSGNYVRYFTKGNKKYGHIIDPETGNPADESFISVTVICNKAVKADALSTAFFIMGQDKALDYVRKIDDIDVILVTDNNNIFLSKNIKERFYLLDQDRYKLNII